MGKAYANRKPVEERPEADFYSTPYSLTRELLRVKTLPTVIYEPAAGNGAITHVLEQHGHIVVEDDIRTTGADFLDFQDHVPCICTNPPFSLFTEFVEKAKECSDVFVFIMKTNFLGVQERVEKRTWEHLKELHIFSRQIDYRTPLREDGAMCVGNLITGWGIWDMSWKEDYFQTRVLDVQKYCTLGSYEGYVEVRPYRIIYSDGIVEEKETSKHELYELGKEVQRLIKI